jgi:hypothetical protein
VDEREDPRARRGSALLQEALRWAVAIPLALLVALALFAIVAKGLDGSWIAKALMRVFPLRQTALTPKERCEIEPRPAITVEGSVGYRAGDAFVPLPDAEIRGEHVVGASRGLDVDASGRFRLVSALPGGSPECVPGVGGTAAATPHLVFRAPGCVERRVPLTAAWVPHRVLLDCPARAAKARAHAGAPPTR